MSASRAVELLAYLVLHAGSLLPRQHLAGVFWPDSSGSQSLTNLRRELHQLKGLLAGAGCLVAEDGALGWRDSPGCLADVREFAVARDLAEDAQRAGDMQRFLVHAQQGITLYRGELMPGHYADWVLESRDSLRNDFVRFCDGSAAAWLAGGELDRAAAVARRRIHAEPLEEAGYRQLIRVQAAQGDRAAAMHTYHECSAVLEQQLGVGPDAVTVKLAQDLLGTRRPGGPVQASSPASGAASGLRTAAARALSARSVAGPGTRSTLVGREQEMALLEARWQAAAAGPPGMVVVVGEPGVGKSRLVEELAATVRSSGHLVATARCFGAPGRVPWAPVTAWLRSRALRSWLAALPPHWQAEAARLVPDLLSGAAAAEAAAGDEVGRVDRAMVDSWQRNRFFEGLAQAVGGTGRPVLLILEDLQWCDAETAAWLAFLLMAARSGPLLLVATMRGHDSATGESVRALLHGMRSSGLLTELALDPLAAVDVGRLAEQLSRRTVTDDEAAWLLAATGGYPLFIIEAARVLPDGSSGSLESVLSRRLAQCSEPAREAAGLAAAYGRDVSLDLLREACDLDAATLVDAVDELWRQRILRPAGAGYDFSHDLLRSAAYHQVEPARRWLLHRRLAQGLELLYAGRPDDAAAQLAEQYLLGSRPDRALEFFQRAALAAAAVFANAEALKFFARCLELIGDLPAGSGRDRWELAIRRQMSPPQTALYGYSSTLLLETVQRTAELAVRVQQPKTETAALIAMFACRFVQGATAESYRIGQRALELAAVESDPDLLGQAHFAVAGPALSLGRPLEAIEHFRRCYEANAGGYSFILGTKLEVHARGWASHAHWLTGDDDGAVSLSAEALTRAHGSGHPYSLAVALSYAAMLHQLRGEKARVADCAAELERVCSRYDFAYYRQWGYILTGWLDGIGGLDRIREGIKNLQRLDAFARMPYWLSLQADVLAAGGDRAAARSALDAALAAAEQRDDRWWLPEVLRQRSLLEPAEAANGTLDRARQLAEAQSSPALMRRIMQQRA
ncbi:ATP-binding protein [Arthrobacter sulfonylureivorans]|uniref:AAA family ATPase n=1 Tax=Arthrobacter sulfonylureivorans TaxID=2486855 RepID=A0ABY3W8B5_9MICC|nr:AAA family ATPase [Arthrobacter sulfonylureivorans]UNK44552.1 AAA family ATPase [Arthrobacter sulfonylureivorans]